MRVTYYVKRLFRPETKTFVNLADRLTDIAFHNSPSSLNACYPLVHRKIVCQHESYFIENLSNFNFLITRKLRKNTGRRNEVDYVLLEEESSINLEAFHLTKIENRKLFGWREPKVKRFGSLIREPQLSNP